MSNWLSDKKFDLVLHLIDVEEGGIREIARKVNISKNTVRKIWREYYNTPGSTLKPKKRKGGYWNHVKNKI